MKKILCFLMLTGIVSFASAQVANYIFSEATNTYTEITGGKVIGSATTAAGTYFTDSTVSAGSTTTSSGIGLPIGFTFKFNGSNFDLFGVNSDGWISLGQSSLTPSVNMNSSVANTPISATSTATAVLQNRVSGFGRNLQAQTISELRYETLGNAPNRRLVVQWKDYKRTTGGAIDTLSFQIRLYETSNRVAVVYGKMIASSSTNTIQVGLRGQSNGDFNNRTTTTDWAATTAGALNTAAMTISATIFPVMGYTYIWAPPPANDAGVTIINSPAATIPSGSHNIAVTIKNFGTDTLKSATIAWSVNGSIQTPHIWSDTLLTGTSYGPDTIGIYNFTLAGNNIIKAWTVSPNGNTDGNHSNDTTTIIVNVLPAKDMAAVAWLTPVGGCGLTSTDTVYVKITNAGTNPQSNIPVIYTIDGGATHVGPEFIAGPVNPGDTIIYKFTGVSDFSATGTYHCAVLVKLNGDQDISNDTAFADVVSLGAINTFPFTENFDNPSYYYTETNAANAGAAFYTKGGVNNTGCAILTGNINNTGWTGTGTIPASAAYGTYTTHHATLEPCQVNATGVTNLRMKFDLKQKYYTQKTYTWLCLIINGTDTLTDISGTKYYNPVTTNADPFTTHSFDLSTYAGTSFNIEFKSACKYDSVMGGAPGNENYIDNIVFWEPTAKDAGVTSIISPISAACGNANDSLIVIVKNFGLDTLINIPVIGDITAPSGGHLILHDTLAGPLAPDVTDTLVVGYGNTLAQGTYNVTAYTDLAADIVFTNDTAHYAFTKYTALTIPHIEDFQSSTPLDFWTSNFLVGNGHGNTSYVMYRNISNAATTGSSLMDNRKTGNLTNRSYLTFDYRIVNSPAGTTGTTLTTDSVFVLISNDCGTSYDTIYTITSGNHVTSASMKHIVLPVAAYTGSKVMPGFFIKRGTAGNYFLDIDNVAFSNAAIVNLGPDTSLCFNESITLDAGASPSGYTYTYNWNTLAHPTSIATTQTIVIDSAATYIAAVDNGFGVITHDTIVVGLFQQPLVNLGPDTSACASFALNPGAGYSTYTWSTGVHTQSINITSTGDYWVDVTNIHGCVARDSVFVTINPLPTVNAGQNQTMCYLDTLQITSAIAADYDSLLWTTSGDGHFNDSTLLNPYYVPGATDIINGTTDLTLTAYAYCDTVSSMINVTLNSTVSAYAGADETICLGDVVQLSATGGDTYAWSPTSNLNNPNISNPLATPLSTTTFTVTVTSTCGSATDNVVITVGNIIAPDLGVDAVLCGDGSTTLDAGTGYDSYLWSTGDNTQTIFVDTNGIGYGVFTYWVEVTTGVCSSSDTISITFDPCVGINEYSVRSGISLYPNPTNGLTKIVSIGIPNAVFDIFNAQGDLVYKEYVKSDNSTFTKYLDLSYLPKGIYLLRISNSKENMIEKLIIQ